MSNFNWNPEMRNLYGVNPNMGHRTRRQGPQNDCNKDIDAIVNQLKNMDEGEILSILEKLGLQTLYSQGIKQPANTPANAPENTPANTPANAPENTPETTPEAKPETKTETTPQSVAANAPAETTETTETTAVEKIEKVDGVGESGSVSSSKWAGVVDENNPVMWLQFMGWDDLYCLVDPNNPNRFATRAGFVVADKYGKGLANVLFDMETGEFSPEKAKAYMESKGIIQLAPGIFSVDSIQRQYNSKTEEQETVATGRTIQIWDPEKHEFNILCSVDHLYEGSTSHLKPGEGALECWEKLKNNIDSETYLNLRLKSDYMDNAMSKYLENGVFKLDGATCDFQVDDSFVDLYMKNADSSIYKGEEGKKLYIARQAAETDFGALLSELLSFYNLARKGLTDEQIQDAFSSYNPDKLRYGGLSEEYVQKTLTALGLDETKQSQLTDEQKLRLMRQYPLKAVNPREWVSSKYTPEYYAYKAAYLAQEYMLLTGETSLITMPADGVNEISGYFGEKTKVHIDNVYTTYEPLRVLAESGNSTNIGASRNGGESCTFIALCGPQKGQDTIDALKEITKYEDNINWYAKEDFGGAKGDMTDPSFAEDTTEWHKKILLEKGLTEEQIAGATLLTGTERIRDRMIKDFGIPENTFFEEDGKIYIDVDAWNTLFYEASIQFDGNDKYEKLKEMFSKMQLSTEHSDMENYWKNMAEELGSITGENGHTGISLSTYYKTQYKTTDALHRIYLSSVAAEEVESGNDIKALVRGKVMEALVRGKVTATGNINDSTFWNSIYATLQGDNEEFFNTLLESYPEFRVIKHLCAPDASTFNELLDALDDSNTPNLEISETWWNYIKEAGSYFNTDVYAIFYDWCQNDWRPEYNTQESWIKDWINVNKGTHPEFLKYSDAKSVSELSFEAFKSFIDCYWKHGVANAALMTPPKMWNLLDNYMREQGFYEMDTNDAHKVQDKTIAGIQQTGITYNGNRPKFISNGTPTEEFKKKLQGILGDPMVAQPHGVNWYKFEAELKALDEIMPGVYGTTDENGNVKVIYYFDGDDIQSYDDTIHLYRRDNSDDLTYILKKMFSEYNSTGDLVKLEAMAYLYMALTNKDNIIIDLKIRQVLDDYYDYFNGNEFHY